MIRFIKENWLILLSLLYILSPIDFIPEMFLGPIGIIDDVTVAFFLLAQAILKSFSKRRKVIEGQEVKD